MLTKGLARFVIIFIFLGFFTPVFPAETLHDVFTKLDFSFDGIEDFSVQKNIVREADKSVSRTIVAQKDETVAKIEITEGLTVKDADRYISERMYIIESLFKRLPNPYPGMITNTIECPESFKPEKTEIKINGHPVSVFVLNSTPRFTYGVCVDELIKYRGVAASLYDPGKKALFRVELFFPKERFDKEKALAILGSFVSGKKIQTGWDTIRGGNLIIIGFDPLGANHLSMYGYSRETSPYLEAFARGGFLFRNAVSPSSWTLPVFMSWFTSLYPSQHRIVNKYSSFDEKKEVYSNLQKLSPGTFTLAQILKSNGYATAGFTGGAGMDGVFGYNQGFDVYYDKTTFGGFDLVFPMAIEWLKEHKKGKFFLFIHGYDVHGRYKNDKNFKNKFADSSIQSKYRGTPDEYWQLRNESLEDKPFNLSRDDVRFWRNWYDGKIYEADRKVGVFLEQVRALGVADNTVIIISSASGNEFYEHKRFDHGYSLYDELIRVPLIIKIPGIQGNVIPEQVRTLDIMPTVLDVLGISCDTAVKQQMRGVSLVPFMKGKPLHLDAFSETDYLLHTFKRSVRKSDGWKFIYTQETDERELYNLNDDSQESNNLIDKEPDKAYELERELMRWRSL